MPRLLALALLALAASACSTTPGVAPDPASAIEGAIESPVSDEMVERPRNVILMIADGFGPASATMGAAAKGAPLAFDSLLVGSVETSASDSRVTDSAASATAYSCGIKTYNGAIGMADDRQPCRTVLELAQATGRATGLVATSRITHATPASFAAHVERRAQEVEIARQLAVSDVDLLFGGGRSFFTDSPDAEPGSARLAPLVDQMRDRGWAVATDRPVFDAIGALPAAAFLADSHLAYEIDRNETDQPSLAEMTTKALDLLAASPAGRGRGFFVMIEGSRIDHAGHGNDPAGHLGDILAYDAAVAAALAWAAADGTTLVVSTADHETGGMTLGRDGIYDWDPAPLLAATASFEAMLARVRAGADPVEVLMEGLALDSIGAADAQAIRAAVASGEGASVQSLIVSLASEPAHVGWTSGGHTAVDVGLYAWGPGAERFAGRMANDAVGRALLSLFREVTRR